MIDPTPVALERMLLEACPELGPNTFRDSLADRESRCGLLMEFSWQFNEWVAAGNVEPIKRALELVDRLVAESRPPVLPQADGSFYNDLLACFVESVMDTTPEFRALVLPNLGPVVRAFLKEHDSFWLGEG